MFSTASTIRAHGPSKTLGDHNSQRRRGKLASRDTHPSSECALGTLNWLSLRKPATYCSSTRRRSCRNCVSAGKFSGSPLQPGRAPSQATGWTGAPQREEGSAYSYLKPIGNFSVDLVDALYSLVQRVHGLVGSEVRLSRWSADCGATGRLGLLGAAIPGGRDTRFSGPHPWWARRGRRQWRR